VTHDDDVQSAAGASPAAARLGAPLGGGSDHGALAPGATAHAWLVIAAAANYPAGQCHPVTASGLRIQAPGQAGVSYVRHAFPACAATSLSGGSMLAVQPVQPGRAKRGTAH
jgi:hypothetical protein